MTAAGPDGFSLLQQGEVLARGESADSPKGFDLSEVPIARDDKIGLSGDGAFEEDVVLWIVPDDGHADTRSDQQHAFGIAKQFEEGADGRVRHPTSPQHGYILSENGGRQTKKILPVADAIQDTSWGPRA